MMIGKSATRNRRVLVQNRIKIFPSFTLFPYSTSNLKQLIDVANMSSTMGEPSNRPIPTRTMPQPARLTVAQRGTSGQVDNQAITDVEALKIDLDRRKLTARKAEKWADRMMEDTLSPLTFKKAVSTHPSSS